jgi:hypothetical protein
VTHAYKAEVLRRLAGRIAAWQATALAPRTGGVPTSKPAGRTTNTEGTSGEAELKPKGTGRKPGPRTDYASAALVAEIVARIAPDGDWRTNLDDICEALNKADIPFPKTWPKRDPPLKSWQDGADLEPTLVKKAIEDRLKKQRKNSSPETLS